MLFPLVACWRYEPRKQLRILAIPHPEFLPSPLRDRVGYFHLDRFRGYLAVHCCSGLPPPCLRFAMAVAEHHARLGTRLRAKLCRGLHFRKLNSMSFQGTTRTDPDERSLAHPVLLADKAAKRIACPHTRSPVGHAQSRSESGTCQVKERSP